MRAAQLCPLSMGTYQVTSPGLLVGFGRLSLAELTSILGGELSNANPCGVQTTSIEWFKYLDLVTLKRYAASQ